MNNSPGSPLFPHFPPPPEYPPPGDKMYNNKQQLRSNSSHRYPDDLDVIEICIEPDPDERGIRNGKPRAKTRTTVNYAKSASQMGDQPVRWSRNNIAVTMERFEPSPTSSITPPNSSSPVPTPPLPSHHQGYHTMHHTMHHQHQNNGNNASSYPHHHPHEYSYAYYEPGAHMSNTMRQTTLQMAALSADPGPSRPPPPNSMRALLNTASRKNSPNNRHMYINHYGTQENVYEEIANDPRMRIMSAGSSMVSLNQSMVEEEFRRIQSRHRRILGELNLSVEAMLMPETPPSTSPTHEHADPTATHDNLNELLSQVGPTDELLSPVSTSAVNGDMDSGFSGSSSSASYVGSLRYHRTNGGNGGSSVCGTQTRSSTPSGGGNASSHSGSIRSSQRSTDDSGITTTASRSFSSVYEGGKCATKKSLDDTEKPQKISFWSRKGWRKIPGFSSTTSVNKAGLANGKS